MIKQFEIPRLATVRLDTTDDREPTLKIVLSPDYDGELGDTDLRKIARKTAGPDDVYLVCNQTSAINNPALAKFVEVMTHWDWDYDGTFDCDHIVEAIETAFWATREKPDEFHRPAKGWYTKLVMAIMPPAPVRHIVFGFGKLQPRFRWYHHVAALPLLAAIIGLIYLQNQLWPWMKYSVVSGWTELAQYAGLPYWVAIVVFIVGLNLVLWRSRKTEDPENDSRSRHTYGFFNKAAVFEEQAFREGSENWSFQQRVRSCFAFGAIHMVNLIYPLSTILPLALGGGIFMFFYLRNFRKTRFRRSAVLDAALWHRVYNRMAFIALAVSLIAIAGLEVIGLFAVFGILAVGLSAKTVVLALDDDDEPVMAAK